MQSEGDSQLNTAMEVVARRFPQHAAAIRQLAARDEVFRDICEELVDAERALASVPHGPLALRKAREDEWQALIERLGAEVSRALRSGNVIPVDRCRHPRAR